MRYMPEGIFQSRGTGENLKLTTLPRPRAWYTGRPSAPPTWRPPSG
jgi:hypothetical protein